MKFNEILPRELFDHLVVTLWAIWGARRKAGHENIFNAPNSVNTFITKYLVELQDVNNRSPRNQAPAVVRSSSWVPPSTGNAKLNVDAAVSQNRRYGAVGAISRSADGSFLGASALVFRHVSEPETLEALAIREALALSDDLYLRRIHVASDCKVVVEDIRKENVSRYGAIIHEIIDHSLTFDFCKFSHEFRSSNFEAHNLAKHALSLGVGRHVWLGQP